MNNQDIFMSSIGVETETQRLYSNRKGSVIRYLANGDREILFSNGNVSYYNAQD